MAWIERSVPRGAVCIFWEPCGHAPATAVVVFQFAPYSPKPVCDYHVQRVQERMAQRDSKYRHPSHVHRKRMAK